MQAIKKENEMKWINMEKCHDGEGILRCQSLLDGLDSVKFPFMHYDEIDQGVSIGVHTHSDNEEIYYLISGNGVLTYDGVEYEMQAGDMSLCNIGHSHGFLAKSDCILIVVGSN